MENLASMRHLYAGTPRNGTLDLSGHFAFSTAHAKFLADNPDAPMHQEDVELSATLDALRIHTLMTANATAQHATELDRTSVVNAGMLTNYASTARAEIQAIAAMGALLNGSPRKVATMKRAARKSLRAANERYGTDAVEAAIRAELTSSAVTGAIAETVKQVAAMPNGPQSWRGAGSRPTVDTRGPRTPRIFSQDAREPGRILDATTKGVQARLARAGHVTRAKSAEDKALNARLNTVKVTAADGTVSTVHSLARGTTSRWEEKVAAKSWRLSPETAPLKIVDLAPDKVLPAPLKARNLSTAKVTWLTAPLPVLAAPKLRDDLAEYERENKLLDSETTSAAIKSEIRTRRAAQDNLETALAFAA